MLDPREPGIDAELKSLFTEYGFPVQAVAMAESYPCEKEKYASWLDDGNNGDMAFLANHLEAKYNPDKIVENARSVIMLAMPYFYPDSEDLQEQKAADSRPLTGRVARYARGRDYHRVIGKKLKNLLSLLREKYPEHSFRSFTDAGPLDEVFYGDQSLLGFSGRHGLLITQKYGSYLFLAEIITTLELAPSSGREKGQCPSSCRRCIQSCPTNALIVNGTGDTYMNASRCISYLTIEYKGSIPLELRPLMGQRIFGCDDCQDVCPFNINPEPSGCDDFKAVRAGKDVSIPELLNMDANAFFEKYKGTALMRPGLELLQRNALVAAGNSLNPDFLPYLKAFAAQNLSDLLSEHCEWAVQRISGVLE